MAKQKGIIHFTGTIQDLNFYMRKGVPVIRMAGGGFNGKAIRTQPSMVRVRENSNEFGRVSTAKKFFRIGLLPFLKDVRDVTLHGRLMRLFQDIKCFDSTSIRGERKFALGLATEKGKQLLKSFALTPKRARAFLPGIGTFDADTSEFRVTDFDVKRLVLPAGATGMQVVLGILNIDFDGGDHTLYQCPPVFVDGDFGSDHFTLTRMLWVLTTGFRLRCCR